MTTIPYFDRVMMTQNEYDDLIRIKEDLERKLKMALSDIRNLKNEIAKASKSDVIDYKTLICQENMRTLRGADIDLLTPQTPGALAKALMPNSVLNVEKSKAIEIAKQNKERLIFRGTRKDCVDLINQGKMVEGLILLTNLTNKELKRKTN